MVPTPSVKRGGGYPAAYTIGRLLDGGPLPDSNFPYVALSVPKSASTIPRFLIDDAQLVRVSSRHRYVHRAPRSKPASDNSRENRVTYEVQFAHLRLRADVGMHV